MGKPKLKDGKVKRQALLSLRNRKRQEAKEAGDEWLAELAEANPEARLADGFESCVVGIANRCGASPVAAYDYDKCVDLLVERDGMSVEDAHEFMSYNVVGAYVGDGTPVFISMRH